MIAHSAGDLSDETTRFFVVNEMTSSDVCLNNKIFVAKETYYKKAIEESQMGDSDE